MRSRYVLLEWLVVCFALLAAPLRGAAPQEGHDREAYAREYVQFLVLQLDQWSKGLPRDYNMALMRPPVDAGKLSESAKAGADDLSNSIKHLASLSSAEDVMTNAVFRGQLEKTLASAKQVNQAMSSQRFPAALFNDWDQIRTNLNSLARIYKLETLAVLEPPAAGGGGRANRLARAAPAPGGGLTGYIVDQRCAARGKGMWSNTACVEKCVRDGDKIVLVTEEGKVYQISNQDKIPAENYGQIVTVAGKVDGETITVAAVQ
jgi:hypothetical protein